MEDISIQISSLRQRRSELIRETQQTEIQIRKLQDSLESLCDHEWEVDRTQYEHHTCYECKKCGASR